MKLLDKAFWRGEDDVVIPVKTRGDKPSKIALDVEGLERDLRSAVKGEVRFDTGSKAMYATDASNFRQVPIGVVIPKTAEDVVATHRICAAYGAPLLSRGCGTSLSGETVNYAVVIDHSKYLTEIGDPDGDRRTVEVQPGAVNEKVNEHVGRWNVIFGPDPSTHMYCTIGGNVGNNSCGIHSVQAQIYGPGPRTSDNLEALEVVTYEGDRFWVGCNEEGQLDEIIAAGGRKGEIYAALRDLRDRYADEIRRVYPSVEELPRRVSGYNLDELLPEKGFNVARALAGTEGTCVTVLRARLLLTPAMLERTLLAVGYDDICTAAEDLPQILEWKPTALEAIDRQLFEQEQHKNIHPSSLTELPQDANAWLLVEFGADDREQSYQRAKEFRAAMEKAGHATDRISIFDDRDQEMGIWQVREGGLGATAFSPQTGDHWPGWEDSAVPPDQVAPYLRDLKALYAKHDLVGAIYGHLGQGCIHSRINFDLRTPEGLANYRSFMEEAADLVVSYGGSLSGEHGDGQQRAELLERQYGSELLRAMEQFKRIWDPQWRMNPGKVVDPYRLDENLKLGADYNPWRPPTKFTYRQDGGDFAHATVRCVGVGKCRTPDGAGVMCPSFIATNEEKYTTRGRARLLFEMLQGEVIRDGWRSPEVKEALDLCLACKGCSSDCPVHVDMPTYKAEFLYHHWAGRLRPRYAYAFGFIDQAARFAAHMPGLVNWFTQTAPFSGVAKTLAGLSRERSIPTFAPVTLQHWFERRPVVNPDGPRVVLWPDTFNNHFHTDVGVACVEAIEAAGWHVVMPAGHVCCGRPLYDYGFLNVAERYLHQTLDVLREEIRAGTPVVGMEPSCLAVFKDEIEKMLPHDDDALRLKDQSYHFPEFFHHFGINPPKLDREAIVWGHCHHKATGDMANELDLLGSMGVDANEVTGGCCGLAGSWGFEQGHHDLSIKIGENALLPAARKADKEALIIADGFSCKTQVAQAGTGRRALHVAQAIKMARDYGERGFTDGRPEDPYYEVRPEPPRDIRIKRRLTAGAVASLIAATGAVIARRAVGGG